MRPSPHILLSRLACAVVLTLGAAACGSAPLASSSATSTSTATATAAAPAAAGAAAPPVSTAPVDSAALMRQLQAELADNGCDSERQCHTIAIGSKACGGPEAYRAWSDRHSDGSRLKQLAAQHAAARRAEDLRDRMMSTCSYVSDPGATCQAGHCVLRPLTIDGPPLQQ
ncbi:hypothetical protein H3H37_22575 [Duganella sp. LX20W]|uniref:Uncharacterized protein n=1 Tax=Rugamonas brunnea TaxID=2758569 RepID=A0A7W2EWC7_9BURK|nr:hypothetical protein [Rugamonas brunnea]MBA5639848.1 hypothetical protein [Rugamonas brunnea]